jgi:hypothetical protein
LAWAQEPEQSGVVMSERKNLWNEKRRRENENQAARRKMKLRRLSSRGPTKLAGNFWQWQQLALRLQYRSVF